VRISTKLLSVQILHRLDVTLTAGVTGAGWWIAAPGSNAVLTDCIWGQSAADCPKVNKLLSLLRSEID
jgi:hypothetical protein